MVLAVDTDDLVKHYGDVEALKGVDIEIEEGAFYGLLGPNGAGKTTFISILVGLVQKTSGHATVFGHDVEEEYRVVRDMIGLAPQEVDIDRFFTIRDVLIHKAGYHGVPPREAAERADELLETFGIADKRDDPVHKLSGGMKRRLLLARSLINDPDLLILDEPTAGVDVELRRELWDVMREMNDKGRTILLTTHYIEEAEQLCEEVTILDEGNVVETASPDEFVKRGIDTVLITLADDAPQDIALDLDGAELEQAGNTLTVRAKGGTQKVPAIIRQLTEQDIGVMDVETKRSSLEDIFVELTHMDGGGR